jgi:hypothetical protein
VSAGVDPGGVIVRNGLGTVVPDNGVGSSVAAGLAAALGELLGDRHKRQVIAQAAREYVARVHAPGQVLPLVLASLTRLEGSLGGKRACSVI